ncbi:holo-ACP synthase [Radiobacillus deserti]|uniref:Holo-[acyl-carrier-protein] synthase n=1 Tax=Radiobacillus deserti TaxID=2594883 RepID=A0A516KCR6_9BACI|nr:holo-ACP synthase [Radiobacillus deserti]QDP39147.1 holo-ACP synthase [Radiobacillus deserti]
MIKGIGIDIVEIARVATSIKQNVRFVERILTAREQKEYEKLSTHRRKVEFVAGRFAAKEAFSKAMGTGLGKLSFQDIEIHNDELGAPHLICQKTNEHVWVSISHSVDYAVAQVILEQK